MIELCLASFLQSLRFGVSDVTNSFSTTASILCFVWIIVFPFYIISTVNKKNVSKLDKEDFKRKYGTLYSEFKLVSFWTRNYLVILIVRRVVLCASLVYLHDYTNA